MEVEEFPEGDDFQPIHGNRKRKKPSEVIGAVTEEGNVDGNLLSNNKFSPLAENKNNNNAFPAGGGGAPKVAFCSKPVGKQKQPPFIVKNKTHTALRRVMSSCKVEVMYKLTPFGQKIICSTTEHFDTVRAHLIKHSVEFYTYEKRCNQPHRVVLRGLPLLKTERVKHLLKEVFKLDVLEVHAIVRKRESSPTEETPYIVLFPKGHTNLRKLSELKILGIMSIRWEAYRNKRPNVTQCRNCLHLGHGTRNCHLKSRCNNCGGPHKTDECQVQEAEPKRCANCSGAHEATDRSCPKRADFIRMRQQALNPKPPVKKVDKRSTEVPALTLADFPPLPSVVPDNEEQKDKQPQPTGDTDATVGGKKEESAAGSRQNHTGPRAGVTPKAEGEEVLYTSEELWSIFTEYTTRLQKCKTRSDQVKVIGYMVCRYGSK